MNIRILEMVLMLAMTSQADSDLQEPIELSPAVKNTQVKDFGELDDASPDIPKWLDSED